MIGNIGNINARYALTDLTALHPRMACAVGHRLIWLRVMSVVVIAPDPNDRLVTIAGASIDLFQQVKTSVR
ncbi:MAG: hypothetical protein EPN69_16050 [Rhodanobacter sp.]|nr:MAG: hypothetical protein EPN69_16050 [Rhodanobacter sp.]